MSQENIGVSQQSSFQQMLPYLLWTIALAACLGSLFFSEIMGFPPCVLCWYQRIAIYPLVAIIAVGIVIGDGKWKWYALPLSVFGLVIAGYHNLLYYGIIPDNLTPCTEGISCTSKQIEWFGFMTIPFLSLMSFVVMTIGLFIYRPISKD